ncbi:MAG: sensor histidine kinase [Herbaspirillum sp.]
MNAPFEITPEFEANATSPLRASGERAHEVERRRFSRELYDDLGQNLSVLKLDLDWLQQQPGNANANCAVRLQKMQAVLDHIIVHTKSIASGLRPPLLDDFGLVATLQWAGERFEKKTGIRCVLQGDPQVARLGEPVDSVIFRIVQEALLNVERHAKASQVEIRLWRDNGYLHLLLSDDGIGITKPQQHDGFGLAAMQQRVAALNGNITIQNTKGNSPKPGLAIQVEIPIMLVKVGDPEVVS